jgi:hypothetical protein
MQAGGAPDGTVPTLGGWTVCCRWQTEARDGISLEDASGLILPRTNLTEYLTPARYNFKARFNWAPLRVVRLHT